MKKNIAEIIFFISFFSLVCLNKSYAQFSKSHGIPPIEALAFQDSDQGTSGQLSVLDLVLQRDRLYAPGTNGFGIDYFATGNSRIYWDAISLVFDVGECNLSSTTLRIYFQKGDYINNNWEWYQLLPGLMNEENEDCCSEVFRQPPDTIDIAPFSDLNANSDIGWIEVPFNVSSDARFDLGNGQIAVTLRLWNFRIDAVELLVSEFESSVRIAQEQKVWDSESAILIHTVELENIGCLDAFEYLVTSQPYSGVNSSSTAKKQVRSKITIPANDKTIVTFKFAGEDGKNWEFKNTEIYNYAFKQMNLEGGSFGPWSSKVIQRSKDHVFNFQIPFTSIIGSKLSDLEGALKIEFVKRIIPEGWSINRISPIPGERFILSDLLDTSINIEINAPTELIPDTFISIRFDLIISDLDIRLQSQIGIHVSERINKLEEFTAYNDLSWGEGQLSKNITIYTTDEGIGVPPEGSTGLLLDYDSGSLVPAVLTVSGGNWNGGLLRGSAESDHTQQGGPAVRESEAFEVFDGKIDLGGLISYGHFDTQLMFSGLSSDLLYEVVLFGNRGKASYKERLSKATISGIVHVENSSSLGADFKGADDESVTIAHGDNTENGFIVKFSDINPGVDGKFTVTISDGGSKLPPKHYINAVCLSSSHSDSKFVTKIGFSNQLNGEQDIIAYFYDEILYISFEDVNINRMDIVRVELKQGTTELIKSLHYEENNNTFIGTCELGSFTEGAVSVNIIGLSDSGESLQRDGTIFIIKDNE